MIIKMWGNLKQQLLLNLHIVIHGFNPGIYKVKFNEGCEIVSPTL